MGRTHLARIAYASSTRSDLPRGELDVLLSAWRRSNAGRGITGLLLYHRESAFQLLEGFPDEIQALYATIAHDPRHQLIAKLIDEPIAQRSFGDWSMGHPRRIGVEPGGLAPLRRLAEPTFRYWHCDEATARALVAAFATGPWRRSIS